jgi:hypothetical protein
MFTLPKKLLVDWQSDMSRRDPVNFTGLNTAKDAFDYLSSHPKFPGDLPFDLADENLTTRWTGRDKFYLRRRKILWIEPNGLSKY